MQSLASAVYAPGPMLTADRTYQQFLSGTNLKYAILSGQIKKITIQPQNKENVLKIHQQKITTLICCLSGVDF